MPESKISVPLPIKGFTDVPSFDATPGNYAIAVQNVRSFDPITRRLRVAQRSGVSKWAPDQFGGVDDPIQFMRHTSLNSDMTTVVDSELDFWGVDSVALDADYGDVQTFQGPAQILGNKMVFNFTLLPKSPYNVFFDVIIGGPAPGVSWNSQFVFNLHPDGTATWATTLVSDDGILTNTHTRANYPMPADDGPVVVKLTFEPLKITVDITGDAENVNSMVGTPGWSQTWSASNVAALNTTQGDYTVPAGPCVLLVGPVPFTHTSSDIADPTYIIGQNGVLYIGDPKAGFTGSGTTFNTSGEVSCTDAFGKAYIVDGDHIATIDLAAQTFSTLTPSAGSLPEQPRLVTLYRGRLVLSRDIADPYNWYMSKINDPTNWDFSSLNPDGAVSGNDADAGRIGDVITALIPFADTYMVMGCPTSLYIMRGDPKAGGSIDLLSNQIGITGPEAWAQGPDGTIYFASRHGLYKMTNGGVPQPMSTGRLDKTFAKIDLTLYQFKLAWNGSDDTLWIAVVPTIAGLPHRVIVWDSKIDAFWIDVYPDDVGPTCIASATGNGGALVGNNRRILLIGGADGYVRLPDDNNFSDDGESIETFVRFAPVKLGDGDRLGKVMATRFEWGQYTSAFSVDYAYFVGNNPQEAALGATAAYSNTFSGTGGYQSLDRNRVRGGALCIELSNESSDNTWSLESVLIEVSDGGRMRT